MKKHGVSFEIAARVFADPFVLIEQDRIEGGEQRCRRWVLLTVSQFCSLLTRSTRTKRTTGKLTK
ncbi:BrnT family toxin [Neorhizobium galegae]|uniref:BrnT family toxin n=1 Tax=Neorhizobium galegae TaxID=399 RepID=UPI003D7ABC39